MANDTRPGDKKIPRLLFFVLLAVLLALQYPLWFGSGGVFTLRALRQELALQREETARLKQRNQALAAEVVDLKQGLEAVEERARAELGMIKKGETFYQVIDTPADAKPSN
jgi:cell division protein FtsB